MMNDKKEITKLIYDELKEGDIKSIPFLISKKLKKRKNN